MLCVVCQWRFEMTTGDRAGVNRPRMILAHSSVLSRESTELKTGEGRREQ